MRNRKIWFILLIIFAMGLTGCSGDSDVSSNNNETVSESEYYSNTQQEDLFVPFGNSGSNSTLNELQSELDEVTGGITGTDKLENNGEVFEEEEITEEEMDIAEYSVTLTGASGISVDTSTVSDELLNQLNESQQMVDSVLAMLQLMSNEFDVPMDAWRVYESDEVSSSMQYEMYHFTDGSSIYTVLASFANDEYLVKVMEA